MNENFLKITIVTAYFSPQNSAGANRLKSIALTFFEKFGGCQVVAPSYKKLSKTEFPSGLSISYAGEVGAIPGNFFIRFIYESWISILLLIRARKFNSDFYLITTPFLPLLYFGSFFLPKSKIIFDIRDLTWEYIGEKGLMCCLKKIMRRAAIISLRGCRLISVTNESEYQYCTSNVRNENIIFISNGIELEYGRKIESLCIKQSTHGFQPTVMYAGTLGYAQGVEILANLAKIMPEWKFEIYGDGLEYFFIEKNIHENSLKNVGLIKKISRTDIANFYSKVHVLFLRLRPGYETAVPSKIYEYLVTGRPVVYMGSKNDAAWRFLSSFENTFFVKNDDITELRNAFLMAKKCAAFSKLNVSKILEEYTREAQNEKFIFALNSLN